MSDSTISVTHQGINIVYRESDNKFVFELRGRERSVDSLREAREAINKPAPKDKKEFKRIDAWYSSYRERYTKVQVTSIVDGRFDECWIADGKNRSKTRLSSVYPCGPKNDEVVAKVNALKDDIQRIEKQIIELEETLKCLEDSKNE